jgi:transposase
MSEQLSRFRTIKQAISYCGLCGEEKSSADKVILGQMGANCPTGQLYGHL